MTFVEQLHLVRRLHYLIQTKATGCPQNLATRLGISRASVFKYLDELRNLGAEIHYLRDRQSYQYENNFKLQL